MDRQSGASSKLHGLPKFILILISVSQKLALLDRRMSIRASLLILVRT